MASPSVAPLITLKPFSCKLSCHHGSIKAENQLEPAREVLRKYPAIDLIEIDVVYNEKKKEFFSSHDSTEELMNKGSAISEWIDAVIPIGKVLWLDVKDEIPTMFGFNPMSKFPYQKFVEFVQAERHKWAAQNVELFDFLIVGCQWDWLYKALRKEFCANLRMVHDLPYAYWYLGDKLFGCHCFESSWNQHVQRRILKNIRQDPNKDIICVDHIFFDGVEDLTEFLDDLPGSVQHCIVYSYASEQPAPSASDLKINKKLNVIVQRDFVHD